LHLTARVFPSLSALPHPSRMWSRILFPWGWVYIMPVIDTCSRRRVEANRLRRKIVVRSRGKITLMISMTIMRGRAGKVPRPAKTRLPYGFEKARRKGGSNVQWSTEVPKNWLTPWHDNLQLRSHICLRTLCLRRVFKDPGITIYHVLPERCAVHVTYDVPCCLNSWCLLRNPANRRG
jgi:hypothetical protein